MGYALVALEAETGHIAAAGHVGCGTSGYGAKQMEVMTFWDWVLVAAVLGVVLGIVEK